MKRKIYFQNPEPNLTWKMSSNYTHSHMLIYSFSSDNLRYITCSDRNAFYIHCCILPNCNVYLLLFIKGNEILTILPRISKTLMNKFFGFILSFLGEQKCVSLQMVGNIQLNILIGWVTYYTRVVINASDKNMFLR